MHGKNMDAFQHLLSRMIENIVKTYVHVHLEVNDYMKAKDERLFKFLDSKIAFVMSTGKTTRIPNLSPYERKKAHNYIATREIVGLSSHSDGEGVERSLFLEFSGPLVAMTTPVASAAVPTTTSTPHQTSTPTKTSSPVDLLSED
jgi:predicted RNA-binding protein Jag